jgi:hypothetical protein
MARAARAVARLRFGAGNHVAAVMTHPLVPSEMIERAARIIDQHAFTSRDELSEQKKQKRQATAKRKAAVILRLWTIAAVHPRRIEIETQAPHVS